jgi:hypothetical protein
MGRMPRHAELKSQEHPAYVQPRCANCLCSAANRFPWNPLGPVLQEEGLDQLGIAICENPLNLYQGAPW